MKDNTISIFIETNRLLLQSMEPEHVTQDYVEWLNDPEFNKYLSSSDMVHTQESCISYVQSYKNRHDRALVGMFFKKNGLHIGNLTLSTIEWQRRFAMVGISLGRKEYLGQGLSTEAMIALRDYCFETLNIHRLGARTAEDNLKSLILFLKSGFKIEGTLRAATLVEGKFRDAYTLGVLDTDIENIKNRF